MSNAPTTTKERALSLLGYGSKPAQVAAVCGVSESEISQLVSDPIFAQQVAELRFKNQAKHNERDNELDMMEDTLIEKMKDLLPMMHRPMEVLKAIQVINQAKRRGASSPEQLSGAQTVVTLVMPITVVQKFTTNIHNQVVRAGNDDLVTIQSSKLLDAVKSHMKESSNGSQRALPSPEGVSRSA